VLPAAAQGVRKGIPTLDRFVARSSPDRLSQALIVAAKVRQPAGN
jgi:hypothetical protein